ncbi:segregation/condensation protein A [Streptomyces sp. NPDC002992]|uniref:segregation and condensation protein A n=1 Tax=Streptomyces sp. NPDC002992 TaxID=3154273 RepID=UPI0033AE8F19
MPPPPDETSRPARRRALGRGPGTSHPAPPPGNPGATDGATTPQPPPTAPASPGGTSSTDAPAGEAPGPGPATRRGRDVAHEGGSGSGQEPAPETPFTSDVDLVPGLDPAGGEAGVAPGPGPATRRGREPAPETPSVPDGTQPGGGRHAAPSGGDAAAGVPLPAGSRPEAHAGPERAVGSAGDPPGREGAPRPGIADAVVAAPAGPGGDDGRFTVRLANFEGPFDLLLQLISKHKLDVTEVALSKVTDEFMAHIRAMGPDWDLDQTTEFLVVAATLLDLKAARLLPAAEVEDEADLALLEARDLLFARLLQYRAYKQIAEILAERWDTEGRRYPRTVGLEAHHAELLPEVVISIGAEGFAKLAVKAMQPKAKPQVYVDHIHAPLVSVREQALLVVALLKERGTVSFRELAEDAPDTLTVVARFLALLELYREKAVALDQEDALGDLTVTWSGAADVHVTDEFDQEAEAPA